MCRHYHAPSTPRAVNTTRRHYHAPTPRAVNTTLQHHAPSTPRAVILSEAKNLSSSIAQATQPPEISFILSGARSAESKVLRLFVAAHRIFSITLSAETPPQHPSSPPSA
jgi:hypothetical protein